MDDKEKHCEDCKYWEKTSKIVGDLNPSGKCSILGSAFKYEGYGIHAKQMACSDFKKIPKCDTK